MQLDRSPYLVGAVLLILLNSPLRARASEEQEEPPLAPGTGVVNPIPQAQPSLRDLCATTSPEQRAHVHAFLVNGCDPFCYANMDGLCTYIKDLGFAAEFSQMYCGRSVYKRVKQVKECDPSAKIVLMGYSLGANTVRTVAQWLCKDGITVDLLYYLAADAVCDGDGTKPCNVLKIINVTGHGSPFFGGDLVVTPVKIDGAENIHLDARHFKMPCQATVVDTLVRELLLLAGGGHVVAPAPSAVRGVAETEPKTLRIP